MSEFAAVLEARGITGFEEWKALLGQLFGAGEGAFKGFAGQVALGGSLQVAVPDVREGVVEANTLEAVIEADRPVVLAGTGGKDYFGQVLEARDLGGLVHGGSTRMAHSLH